MRWTDLTPSLSGEDSKARYLALARSLESAVRISASDADDDRVERFRSDFSSSVQDACPEDRQALRACGLVLADLFAQGWLLRICEEVVQIHPPLEANDRHAEKERIREQELVRRNAQLREPATRKFVHSMERTRLHRGGFASVFSLMRDGRELAESLRAVRDRQQKHLAAALKEVINPYLQFVTEDARCDLTGLRLMDIWRYFRHTWTNRYTSVPGRSMMFIVRDRATQDHPVVGIGALASPVVQIRERDLWIGWHPEALLREARTRPTLRLADWLVEIVDRAIGETYVADLIEDGVLTPMQLKSPSDDAIAGLLRDGESQRRLHHRFAQGQRLKKTRPAGEDASHWEDRARTHLFRSKRAAALASYLQARQLFNEHLCGSRRCEALGSLAGTTAGASAIRKVAKKAKADKIGISVADISVCGAIQPYNAILGGKLVSMLAASPQVVEEYRRRYSRARSEIASSMAGRGIVRPSDLVLLCTTSLYGTGSSQYNRIRIPCDRVGGDSELQVRFEKLGQSKAFGTSQYSDETVAALYALVEQSSSGQRVNSIFGEGVSPRLRKVRQGLDLLGFPPDELLRHHRHRVLYGVKLIRNLREYLLGADEQPQYLMPRDGGVQATDAIAHWWRDRWLKGRIRSEEFLDACAQHSLVRPVRHGARVSLPAERSCQSELFEELLPSSGPT